MSIFLILFFMTLIFGLIIWYNLYYLPANPETVYIPKTIKK